MLDSVTILDPGARVTDANGDPVSGAKLKFYDSGTSTPRTVYSDSGLTVSLGATVTCDSGGYPTSDGSTKTLIWTGTAAYKIVITDADDVVIATHDGITGAISSADLGGTGTGVWSTPTTAVTTDGVDTVASLGKVVQCDPTGGSFTRTLPSAVTAGNGARIGYRHNGTAGQVKLAPQGGQTLALATGVAASGYALTGRGHAVWLVSDGANWSLDIETHPIGGVLQVVSRITVAPASPVPGARYILSDTPTGTLLSQGFAAKDIAEADGQGGWIRYTPATDCGWIAYVQAEDLNYQYQGTAWVALVNITAPTASVLKHAVWEDQKANGTAGGAATSGSRLDRVLNTEVVNTIPGASLAANVITLPAGTYLVDAEVPFLGTQDTQVFFQSTTDAAVYLASPSASVGSSSVTTIHRIIGILTLAAADTFKLQYQISNTVLTNGLGNPTSFNEGVERYSKVRVVDITATQGPRGEIGLTGDVGAGYGGTSTTSLAIGTGSKTFATQAGLAYVVGSRIRAASVAAPAVDYMEGVVTSYSGTSLAVAVDLISGSGTVADWTLSIAGARGPAGAVGSYVSAATNLWPDPFFDLAKGDKSYVVGGKAIYLPDHALRSWDAGHISSFGVGAWLHATGAGATQGYACHFADLSQIGTDDTISLGMIFRTAATKNVKLDCMFFAGTPGTWVTGGGHATGTYVTGTGGEDLVVLNNLVIPAGATGVCLYPYSLSAADFRVLAAWANLNAVAGVQPPPRRRRLSEPNMVRAAAGDLHPMVEAVLKQRSDVTYASRSAVNAATLTSTNESFGTIAGYADSYVTPGSIAFNAVRILSIARHAGSPEWYRAKVVVRTHATTPLAASSTIVAVGEAFLDPDARTAVEVLVPLRDPVTNALKNVTQADLLANFMIGFWAVQRDGTMANAGYPGATMTGLTRVQSAYTETTRDPSTAVWSNASGNPVIGIQLEQLTTPVQAYTTLPRAALSSALGVPPTTTLLTAPAPWEPVLPPRLYAMVGREANVYLADMHSGAVPRAYDVTCSVGKQQRERWTGTPVTAANDVAWSVNVLDADHGSALGTASSLLQVGSATAAAGAVRRVLCIGDSTTAEGRYTQRMLDIAAANTGAAQLTLLGTQGAGSNKHEGYSGWNTSNFYQSDTVSGTNNPLVTGAGNKFDLAAYLTATGQSAPHIVLWHLGMNDVFAATSDAAVNAIMDTMVDQLSRMIGITADAAVGSVIESYANAVNIVAMPISPVLTQDGFDAAYGNGQTRWRYKRNITICAYRLKEAFKGAEASRVYLLPWNVTVDGEHGWQTATAAANTNTAMTVTRPIDALHPENRVGQLGGYEQMGDAAYACINWLVATGRSV